MQPWRLKKALRQASGHGKTYSRTGEIESVMGPLTTEGESLKEVAERAANSLIESVRNHFDDKGDAPFTAEAIDLCLKSLSLLELKSEFRLEEPCSVIAYLEELKEETLKNEILSIMLAYSIKHGDAFSLPSEESTKASWVKGVVVLSYVLSCVTTACLKNDEVLKNAFAAIKEVRQTPAWTEGIERVQQLHGKGSLAAEFGMIKRCSATFLKKPKKQDLQNENPFLNFALSLNIVEAVLLERVSGYCANAKAGLSLVLAPNIFRVGNKQWRDDLLLKGTGIGYHLSLFPRNFTDLYVSWNLCFMCTRYHYTPYPLTSLFHMATMRYERSTSSTEFMAPRAISLTLYLHLNTTQYSSHYGGYEFTGHSGTSYINQTFVKRWAKLNELYSKKYDQATKQVLRSMNAVPSDAPRRKPFTNTDLTLKLLIHCVTSRIRDLHGALLVRSLRELLHDLQLYESVADVSVTRGLDEEDIVRMMKSCFGHSCFLQEAFGAMVYHLLFRV